jgi:pyridoxine 5-phosphate synthase
MIHLSVNVNKVATLRNARGGNVPRVLDAVRVCVDAGVPGITVHPRADARHITPDDVRQIAAELAARAPSVEFNIEGDPRPDLIALVHEVRPAQCTLVPVRPGEVTSQAGWSPEAGRHTLDPLVRGLRTAGIRVSLFVDPEPDAIRWAAGVGADRIELYTEPYARAFELGRAPAEASFAIYAEASRLAASLGLGVNAGHDLDLQNLYRFRDLPRLDEVSIGHALISHALYVGLKTAVRDFLDVLAGAS